MLKIEIEPQELYDHNKKVFLYITEPKTFELEHSLQSVSRWEAEHEKTFLPPPFLDENEVHITPIEWRSYFNHMVLGERPTEEELDVIFVSHRLQILKYIAKPMSGTIFGGTSRAKTSNVAISSELIYYWMSVYDIPYTPSDEWHLNRLLALIKIANIKNDPKGTMTLEETTQLHRNLNAERRRKYMKQKG